MKRLLVLILLTIVIYAPQSVNAAQEGSTTGDEKTYCENGHWIKKSGCKLNSAFQKKIDACNKNPDCIDEVSNSSETDIYICDFQQLSETSETEGGIRSESSAVKDVFGKVAPPSEISRLGFGEKGISNVLQVIVRLIYIIGAIAFVILFLWSAVQLILSGGDKEKVGQARQRITWAIIGLALLAFAFVIFRILETVLGFKLVG